MAKDKEYKENANESSSNNTIESKYPGSYTHLPNNVGYFLF